MRKIDRDNLPPQDLYLIGTNKGISKWRVVENAVIKAFINNAIPFNDGTFSFPSHPSYEIWRKELINLQGFKCCFCEKPIKNGALEHFRPKKGWQENKGDALTRPGYFWLAYRWKNMFLSCTDCNESGQKGNLFPIDGVRALRTNSNLNVELPKLINPYDENPNIHLSFYKSDPISHSERGRKTIEIFKLKDRADIKEIRKDTFDLYETAMKIANLTAPIGPFTEAHIQKFKNQIRVKLKSKQPFSGMIVENLRQNNFD